MSAIYTSQNTVSTQEASAQFFTAFDVEPVNAISPALPALARRQPAPNGQTVLVRRRRRHARLMAR